MNDLVSHARRPTRSHHSDRRGISAQCPNRGRLTAVPLGLGHSLHDFRRELPPLVQSLRKYYGLIRLLIHVRAACRLPEPARHTSPGVDETSQVPRKEVLHVHKVSDCARFFPCKPFAMESSVETDTKSGASSSMDTVVIAASAGSMNPG